MQTAVFLSVSPLLKPLVLTAVISYLLGSVNFAIIVSRLRDKDDVRRHGSGNAGATNMLRTFGKTSALLTALGDFSKGLIAVLLCRYFFAGVQGLSFNPAYVAGLFALLGHLFPLYFKFKGGKGVLTSLSIILVVNPIVFAALVILLVPVLIVKKIVSLVSVLGAILYPIFTCALCLITRQNPFYDTLFAAIFGALVLFMHRSNIKRLLNGTEPSFGQKKEP